MSEETYSPDECWESVFKFLNHHQYLEPLSLVSKQFLSITNRFRSNFPLTICDPTLPSIPRLLHRFPTLTSLNLTRFRGDLDALLRQISQYELPLRSLDISNQRKLPSDGLRELSKKVATLKTLRCSHMGTLKNADVLLIVECFPFLEELDISFPGDARYVSFLTNHDDFESPVSHLGVKALSLGIPKLRKVNISGIYFTSDSIVYLCINCELLEEIVLLECSQNYIASAIKKRPNLRSLSVELVPGGSQPQVSAIGFGMPRDVVTLDFISSLVSLRSLNCLDLSGSRISNELLYAVAEACLPLRKLVLRDCSKYSDDGIFRLLSKCQLVQHLDLQNARIMGDRFAREMCVFLGNLIYINLSGNERVTEASFFALTRNCPLLSEIKMEDTGIGKQKMKEEPLMDLVVNSQVKSLHLARISRLER